MDTYLKNDGNCQPADTNSVALWWGLSLHRPRFSYLIVDFCKFIFILTLTAHLPLDQTYESQVFVGRPQMAMAQKLTLFLQSG